MREPDKHKHSQHAVDYHHHHRRRHQRRAAKAAVTLYNQLQRIRANTVAHKYAEKNAN